LSPYFLFFFYPGSASQAGTYDHLTSGLSNDPVTFYQDRKKDAIKYVPKIINYVPIFINGKKTENRDGALKRQSMFLWFLTLQRLIWIPVCYMHFSIQDKISQSSKYHITLTF